MHHRVVVGALSVIFNSLRPVALSLLIVFHNSFKSLCRIFEENWEPISLGRIG